MVVVVALVFMDDDEHTDVDERKSLSLTFLMVKRVEGGIVLMGVHGVVVLVAVADDELVAATTTPEPLAAVVPPIEPISPDKFC